MSVARPAARRLYLALYDIASDRRRRRAFAALERAGAWTQYSAFFCALPPTAMDRLGKTLRLILDSREDRLLIVDLGEEASARSRLMTLGDVQAPEKLHAYLVV
jgi:CRISPR-associated endonuclease Cas2